MPCADGKKCIGHKDCASLLCTDSLCVKATCNDSRKNQNEEGIDCGGPCSPCPTCFDKIKNQDEQGIDCGGQCKKCETCFDNIKNQNEFLVDCGGPCQPCRMITIFVAVKNYILIMIPLIIASILYFIIRRNYESDRLGFYQDFAKLTFFIPKRLPDDAPLRIESTIVALKKVKESIFLIEDKNKLVESYRNCLDGLFKYLTGIEAYLSYGTVKKVLGSKIMNPFVTAMFLELYSLQDELNIEASLFKIELNGKIDESNRILTMIENIIKK